VRIPSNVETGTDGNPGIKPSGHLSTGWAAFGMKAA
jgi:hypothetical protein